MGQHPLWFNVVCLMLMLALSPLAGKLWACSTACHSTSETAYCASIIGQKAYSMCRSGSLKLPGFPNFESVVSELKTSTAESPTPAFEVCIPVPNGLAIKQNLVDYWSGMDAYQLQVADMVKAHNQKYNPHGTKRGASDMSQGDQGGLGWIGAKHSLE